MEFRLLGPLEVRAAAGRVETGPAQRRLVLAVLLADAGRPVPIETLIDRVWGDTPPRGARQSLWGHISRIRQALHLAAGPGGPPAPVVQAANCYRLDIDELRVDLHRFRRLAAEARSGDDRCGRRVELLRQSMELWRGEPLTGLTGVWVEHSRQVWQQQHLDVAVAWAQAELEAGNSGAPIDVLTDLSHRFPLTEPVVAVLIRALAAAGRPADALARYDRMRRLLNDELGTDPSPDLQAAYQTILQGERTDEFVELVTRARQSPEPEEARVLFRTALDLRRDGDGSQQYASAAEDWAELALAAGDDTGAVAGLGPLVGRFPLRQRMRSQLMLALHRAGRPAEALAEYHRVRVLLDEARTEPGPELRETYQRLLTGWDPAAPARVNPVNALPRAVGDFTGRESVIRRMVRSVEASGASPHIEVVDGMAGSGKTTLAVHLAGLVQDRYPDAQLFLDLHGHSKESPVDPSSALVTLLRQLGLPATRIPESLSERILLWRAELTGLRALVVLDNAESTAQVTPLLPTAGAVLTLITSRRRLVGLDAIQPEPMPVLSDDEAVTLLATIAGERIRREPEAAAEVVRRCGALPLAIRLAGARLAHRPGWRVADLARRLGEAALNELAAEDRTVAGAFAVSYRQLSEPAQRMFRLLGRQPVELFGVLSVAALTGLPLDRAQDHLDDLVDVHLVEEPRPGRYRLHDLVREFAGTLRAPDGERAAALSALVDFHLHTSAAVARTTELLGKEGDFPAEAPARPELTAVAATDPAWFEEQRPHLLGLMNAAAEVGEPRRAWQLARSAWYVLYRSGYTDDLLAAMNRGLDLAMAARDGAGVALMRNYLASGYYRSGLLSEAVRHLTDLLEHHRMIGSRVGEARVTANLGGVMLRQGNLVRAYALQRQSYEIYRELDQASGLAARLADLAMTSMALGRDVEALTYARRAMQLGAELRQRYLLSFGLLNAGQARLRLGAPGPARRLLTAALRLARESGHRVGEAEITNELGRVAAAQGRWTDAVELHLAARDIVHDQNDRRGAAYISNDLAVTLFRMGDAAAALDLHRHALDLTRRVGHAYGEGRSLAGIADCLAADDPDESRRHRQRALVIFTKLGAADRFDVQRRLDGDPPGPIVVPSRGTMGA